MNDSDGKEPTPKPPKHSTNDRNKMVRRTRVAKEEMDAKMERQSSKSPSRNAKQRTTRRTTTSTPGAVSYSGSPISGGIAIGVKAAKDRKPDSRGSVSKPPTRGDDRDRDAKRRARRNDASGAVTSPGAVSSAGEHRSSKNTGRHHSSAKQSSILDPSDRRANSYREHKKDRHRTRASTPGAVSSKDDSKVSSKSRGGKHSSSMRSSRVKKDDTKTRSRPSKPGAAPSSVNEAEHTVIDPDGHDDGVAVFAKTVDEDEEEERMHKMMAEKEAQIRQELEERQRQEEPHQEEQREEPPSPQRKKNNRMVCIGIFCVLLIAGGVVAALFATGTFSSEAVVEEPKKLEENQTTSSPTFILPVTPAPSDLPSSSPTWLAYDRPPVDQCVLISQGLDVDGQDDMIEKNYLVQMDVDLSFNSELQVLLDALKGGLQQVTAPKLAGCDIPVVPQGRRNLRLNDEFKYIIGNAIVLSITMEEDRDCINSPEPICLGMSVKIALYVKGNDLQNLSYFGRFADAINNVESEGGIVSELGLDAPFVTIRLFSVKPLDPTAPPSIGPSAGPTSQPTPAPTLTITFSPTFAPVDFPTTNQPTKSPSMSPTVSTQSPTQASSPIPTQTESSRPSLRPSIQPAPGATPVPTSSPSNGPSLTPSSSPSLVPSKAPSDPPSTSPSLAPSQIPSPVPSANPSRVPSVIPSLAPSEMPSGCTAPATSFGPALTGYCLMPDGQDQNDGVTKILEGDYGGTQESIDLCLVACACYADATGCEMVRNRPNRGCYVHTEEVQYGSGDGLYKCYLSPIAFAPSENPSAAPIVIPSETPTADCPVVEFEPISGSTLGYCVDSANQDQNDGVVKLLDGDYGHSEEAVALCLAACSCYPGVTGCEMIHTRGGAGCYVHTQEVDHGDGTTLVYCYKKAP